MNKTKKNRTFYIISSLSRDESFSQLAFFRRMFATEKEAREVAHSLVISRQAKGQCPLSFFILKAVCRVGYALPPVTTERLK